MSCHVLVLEDEERIASLLGRYLDLEGYRYTHLKTGTNAAQKIQELQPDLCIMDVMLPGEDGLSICQQVRRFTDTPIIMLTARVDEVDKLLGFKYGADDYVCKPFSPRELMARIAALLKRCATKPAKKEQVLNYKGLSLDIEKFEVRFEQQFVKLTLNEFSILRTMMSEPERVFSRKELLYSVKQQELEIYLRTIDTHIKNLRKKLSQASGGDSYIVSVYGLGYSLKVQQ